MLPRSLTVLLFVAVAQAQTYPPAFPRDGAKKLFENARVAVWDVVWPKGQPSPLHEHRYDQVSVTLVGAMVRVTKLDGTSTVNQSAPGSVTFTAKGTVHREEGLSDPPQHKIMVEMKGAAKKEGAAAGSPGDGAVKLMENERVIAWDYTWKAGRVAAPRANEHDTVWVFLEGGALSIRGALRTAGQAIYMPASTDAAAEQVVRGTPHAVILELK